MRLDRRSILKYALIGSLVIVALASVYGGYWVYLILTNQCPIGQKPGSPGAPSGCVPANYQYPTVTPFGR